MHEKDASHLSKESSRVAADIRRQIYVGNLRVGDKLLPERDLLSHFGVSKPTLREGLRILEAEALINIMRGAGGVRVREPSVDALSQQVGGFLQREGANMEDIHAARLLIEPMAAKLLATNSNRAAIELLEKNVRDSYACRDNLEEFQVLFGEFSKLLADNCGNKTISLLAKIIHRIFVSQIRSVDLSIIRKSRNVQQDQEYYLEGRTRLISAVVDREPELAQSIWHEQLVQHGKITLSAYRAQMPIDVMDDKSLSL